MRATLVMTIAILASAVIEPGIALQANDTMRSWKTSSARERTELLDQVLGKRNAEGASIRKCLDEASNVPGHADLQIGEIVKACGSASDAGDPV